MGTLWDFGDSLSSSTGQVFSRHCTNEVQGTPSPLLRGLALFTAPIESTAAFGVTQPHKHTFSVLVSRSTTQLQGVCFAYVPYTVHNYIRTYVVRHMPELIWEMLQLLTVYSIIYVYMCVCVAYHDYVHRWVPCAVRCEVVSVCIQCPFMLVLMHTSLPH